MEKNQLIKKLSLAVMKSKGLITDLPDGSATFDKRDLKKISKRLKSFFNKNHKQ